VLASVVFLTPVAALAALGALLPLAALAVAGRRERRGRRLLELPDPPASRRLGRAAALAAVPILLGLAAAQPAVRTTSDLRVRTDAEALFVLDNSRSMLAASAPGDPSRLARAKAVAETIRDGLADIPSGVATLSDRVLPNLLPDPDPAVFRDTVAQAVGIEQPPPASTAVVATSLAPLGSVPGQNLFQPTARHRLLVVLTDGESRPFDAGRVARELRTSPSVDLLLVQVGHPGEAVFVNGKPEPGYRPDPAAHTTLESLAAATGGTLVGEGSAGRAIAAARRALGRGPVVAVGRTTRTRTLAPYLVLAALVPLLLVLWLGFVRSLRTLSSGVIAFARLRGGRPALPAAGPAPRRDALAPPAPATAGSSGNGG
jgi:hypothetical protein